MAYTKIGWEDSPSTATAVSATNLGHMDDGIEKNASDIAALGSGGIGDNALINSNFAVNQRGKSGTVTLSANQYGHDRWKAGTSGCTYTFSTVANITTITITAGTLEQVIEGINLQSGTYVLSWIGTAQGRIDSGTYSASGVTGTLTGGTNATVEFGTGTISKVKLEIGDTATDYIVPNYAAELTKCLYYFQTFKGVINSTLLMGFAIDTTVGYITLYDLLYMPMRTVPTPTYTADLRVLAMVGGINASITSMMIVTETAIRIVFDTPTAIGNNIRILSSSDDGEISFSAEL